MSFHICEHISCIAIAVLVARKKILPLFRGLFYVLPNSLLALSFVMPFFLVKDLFSGIIDVPGKLKIHVLVSKSKNQ